MNSDEKPKNPELETASCLKSRLVELDLLEQAINQGQDIEAYKLKRLEDLQQRLKEAGRKGADDPIPPEGCTCGALWTVRGEHGKPDCPHLSNADRGLRQKIDAINLKYMHNTGWNGHIEAEVYRAAMDEIMELVKSAHSDLLSRIKEEVIGEDEAGGYGRGVQPVRNNLREKQRTKLDNIAKEIRGEHE